MPKIAVVILNWNGEVFLEKFLPSVTQYSNNQGIELYVADNNSSDNSVPFLKENYPKIKLILLDKNYGFAEGYNQALSKIEAEYFILLNSDVEVTENWILPIIDYMEKNKDVAAVQPKILAYNNKEYFEYAGAAGGFIDKFGYPFCRGRIISEVEKDEGQYDNITEIFWATGACMFVRADLYKKTGGLDADFFAHMEEIDLCWRLKNEGYKIVYSNESKIYHVGGGTLGSESPHKLFLNYRNNLLLLYKNLPASKLFFTIYFRLLLDGLSGLVYLASFKFSFFFAVIKAHFDFYSKIPIFRKKRKLLLQNNNKSNHKEILKKSIVFNFMIKKNKKFTDLEW